MIKKICSYCSECRALWIDRYGTIQKSVKRHVAICKEVGCHHAPYIKVPQEAIDEVERRCRREKR